MPPPRSLRLLVVDDHPDSAETTAQLLALHGHDTRAACTCADARALLTGPAPFAPELVLMDVRLPDGDGVALGVELSTLLPARPVLIALTGLPGQAERCRAAGFDECLLKPTEPAALVALIARYATGGSS
jgi:CheY-like chemotaxis protein